MAGAAAAVKWTRWRLALVLLASTTRAVAPRCGTDRPLIGILSQPGEPAPHGHSYFAASYVKFVEAGGARAVPIPYDLPARELRRRFQATNGLLIPGGGQDLRPGHGFYDAAAELLRMATDAHDANGTHWPVWGTCLGFEALAIMLSRNTSVLGSYDSLDLPSPLALLPGVGQSSRMFSAVPPAVLQALQSQPLVFQNHLSGLGEAALAQNPPLDAAVRVLAYSQDRRGRQYVSAFEGKHYPIYGVQFHPEKNAYEWAPQLAIPRGPQALAATHAFSAFLGAEAGRNCHAPADDAELDELLIYNHAPMFTGKVRHHGEETDFDQIYVFPERSLPGVRQGIAQGQEEEEDPARAPQRGSSSGDGASGGGAAAAA